MECVDSMAKIIECVHSITLLQMSGQYKYEVPLRTGVSIFYTFQYIEHTFIVNLVTSMTTKPSVIVEPLFKNY